MDAGAAAAPAASERERAILRALPRAFASSSPAVVAALVEDVFVDGDYEATEGYDEECDDGARGLGARVDWRAFANALASSSSSVREHAAIERAVARGRARALRAAYADVPQPSWAPGVDERAFATLGDDLVTCEKCLRAVMADALEAHARWRCDGGVARRGRDVSSSGGKKRPWTATTTTATTATATTLNGNHAKSKVTNTTPAGAGSVKMQKLSKKKTHHQAESVRAPPTPLASRVDVRAARRANDALVFGIMYNAPLPSSTACTGAAKASTAKHKVPKTAS